MATVMPLGLLTAAPIALLLDGDELWPLGAEAWVAVVLLTVLTGMVAHGLSWPPSATCRCRRSACCRWRSRRWPSAGLPPPRRGDPLAQVPGMVLVIIGLAAFTLVSSGGR